MLETHKNRNKKKHFQYKQAKATKKPLESIDFLFSVANWMLNVEFVCANLVCFFSRFHIGAKVKPDSDVIMLLRLQRR